MFTYSDGVQEKVMLNIKYPVNSCVALELLLEITALVTWNVNIRAEGSIWPGLCPN